MTEDGLRKIGLARATFAGIGATIGGGIFVLAGIAYAVAGPGIILAYTLNGLLALLTACAFMEMSTAFPQSGGVYTFAKNILSVRLGFATGWVLWLAYIVGATLYAKGFASYFTLMLYELSQVAGLGDMAFLNSRAAQTGVALGIMFLHSFTLLRGRAGIGPIATVIMLCVFAVLVAIGMGDFFSSSAGESLEHLSPFLPGGMTGVLAAMGYTFITLQGFGVISAVAGEIKEPRRTIPRAMVISLSVAVLLYLSLLLVVTTVGMNDNLQPVLAETPERFMAVAVQNYTGDAGYWFIIVVTVLATFSALFANLLAGSRVALTMAEDRTLPQEFARMHTTRNTPAVAIYATGLVVAALVVLLPNLEAAGAAASLIFLIAFSLAHVTSFLARRRGTARRGGFLAPFFPAIPIIGGLGCIGLACFQAWIEPVAAFIVLGWLGVGIVLYLAHFSTRAEAIDAHAESRNPELVQFRGRAPLVLVPVANPANAGALIEVASALAPPKIGQVMLLSVVTGENEEALSRIEAAQQSLRQALERGLQRDRNPEALLTVAPDSWAEISRVAEEHDCESLLLGFTELPEGAANSRLEKLFSDVDCDVGVLRAFPGWDLSKAKRILVPIGGRGHHDSLRARLLGSLTRNGECRVSFLRVLQEGATEKNLQEAHRFLDRLAREEAVQDFDVIVECASDPVATIVKRADEHDLVVLGLQQKNRREKVFGSFVLRVTGESSTPVIMIGRG